MSESPEPLETQKLALPVWVTATGVPEGLMVALMVLVPATIDATEPR